MDFLVAAKGPANLELWLDCVEEALQHCILLVKLPEIVLATH